MPLPPAAVIADARSLALGLYRAQLRLARALDASPALGLLLRHARVGPPEGALAARAQRVALDVAAAAEALRTRVLAERGVAWPPVGAGAGAGGPTWAAAVREGFRAPPAGGDDAVALDAAFNVHRAALRAREVADAQAAAEAEPAAVDLAPALGLVGDALAAALDEAPAIAPGVALLEHPAAIRPGRGVLLVFDIAREAAVGEPGAGGGGAADAADAGDGGRFVLRALALNRPFPGDVASVTGYPRDALGALAGMPVFHGGPDSPRALFLVHARADVPGATAIDPAGEGAGAGSGLFVGGDVAGVTALIASGAARPDEFKVVLGATHLPLEGDAGSSDADGGAALELGEPGRWLAVRGSAVAAAALLPPVFAKEGAWANGRGLGMTETITGYNYGRFWHQNAVHAAMWRAATRGDALAAALGGATPAAAHVLAAMGPLPVQLVATAAIAYAQAAADEGEDGGQADAAEGGVGGGGGGGEGGRGGGTMAAS